MADAPDYGPAHHCRGKSTEHPCDCAIGHDHSETAHLAHMRARKSGGDGRG